jgi:hypothetical protein
LLKDFRVPQLEDLPWQIFYLPSFSFHMFLPEPGFGTDRTSVHGKEDAKRGRVENLP